MILLSVDWAMIIEKLILILVVVLASLGIALYATFAERKVAGYMQDRFGPNRAGPFGLLQPLCDGLKLIMKEEIIPAAADKPLFILGPGLAMGASLMTCAVIPWGDTLSVGHRIIQLQIADINIGILYVFAVTGLGIYGILLGGWASNNKFSLLGAVRGASQMISYEIAMGLSLIALFMLTGTLQPKEMVMQQAASGHLWNVVYQPIAFLIFLVCSFAECNRTPFDLAEADSELNVGFHQEYSSLKMGFYMFSEYVNMFISGAIMSTMFFGGYDIPFVDDQALQVSWGNWVPVLQICVLLVKSFLFIFLYFWIRWTIPRFRYDQLMDLGWKKLLPLALANMLLTAVIILCLQH